MPAHIVGNQGMNRSTHSNVQFKEKNFNKKYKHLYPEGVNLRPGTEDHDNLVEEVMLRAEESERFMSNRHTYWKEFDRTLNVFIPLDDEEERLAEGDIRYPVSIVVPESYATLETLLTYMMAAFSSGPLFQYNGVGPEDRLGCILLEQLIEMQMRRTKALLALHTQWRDAFTYGFGVVSAVWKVEMGKRSVVQETGFQIGGEWIPNGVEKVLIDAMLYEGGELHNIDPYKYLPDPNVPVYQPDRGEYVGWVAHENYIGKLREEGSPGSSVFNMRYLEDVDGQSHIYMRDASGRDANIDVGTHEDWQSNMTRPMDTVYMYIDLIPKEFGLGKSEEPQKWLIAVTGDKVITQAHPLSLTHNHFPIGVAAPNFAGHDAMPISVMQVMSGLQKGINYEYNTHLHAIAKALHNLFIVDPKTVNMRDIKSGSMFIRTRKPVWGRPVKEGIQQLQVTDMTRNNIQDMMITRELSRNATGAVDALQGLQRTGGERVTKAEFMNTRSSALSRLQKTARVISMQSMATLGEILTYQTQQFMSTHAYAKTVGRWEEVLRNEYGIQDPSIKVSPFDLDIAFDVEISDGTIKGDEYLEDWKELYQMILQNPETAQQIDTTRVFLHIARMAGADDVQDFMRKGGVLPTTSNVVPDGMALEGAANGRLSAV